MMIVFTMSLVLIPFYTAFVLETQMEEHELWQHVTLILDIFCMADICITFLTGYFVEEEQEIILDFIFVSK